ncbi:hypothetical protein K8S19_06885 [bacterium]|nr:hypothetical protein [bacterium]
MIQKHQWETDGGIHIGRAVIAVLGGIALAVIIGLVVGILVKFLWNTVMVSTFGLPVIGYWQAVGLFILGKILFGIRPHDKGDGHRDGIHRKIHRWIGVNKEKVDDGEAFKKYWREEGEQAYQRFLEEQEQDNLNK